MTDPRTERFGDLLLGGLPRGCGADVVVSHLRAIEQLGAVTASHNLAITRAVTELKVGLAAADRQRVMTDRIIKEVIARRLVDDGEVTNPTLSWADRLGDALQDTWSDFALGARLLHEFERHDSLADLGFWLAEERSVLDALNQVSRVDLAELDALAALEPPLCTEIESIDCDIFLLGLHEMMQCSWITGRGMSTGRVATASYLQALKSLNRNVVHAYALLNWGSGVWSDTTKEVCGAVDDLIRFAIPFELPRSVNRLLLRLTSHYQTGDSAVVVILGRALLEAVFRVVYTRLGQVRPPSLSRQVQRLVDVGVLSREGMRCANAIRVRGNKAIHEDAGQVVGKDVSLATIESISRLLMELRPVLE